MRSWTSIKARLPWTCRCMAALLKMQVERGKVGLQRDGEALRASGGGSG